MAIAKRTAPSVIGGKTGRDSLIEIKEKPHTKTQAIMERSADFLRSIMFRSQISGFNIVNQSIIFFVTLIRLFGEEGVKGLIVGGQDGQEAAAFFAVHFQKNVVK